MTYENLLFSFQGRTRRLHWWLARLAIGTVGVALMVAGIFFQYRLMSKHDAIDAALVGLAVMLLSSLVLWITLALSVKRLHDLGWSGWLVLVEFVPLIGGLFSLICLGILDGNPGPNQFGPSPKGLGGDAPAREAEAFA